MPDEFDDLTPSDFEQILRVLAYVRKEDDAIPDFLASGFVDDAKEVRLAEAQLAQVLHRYKAWRLERQVPLLWMRSDSLSVEKHRLVREEEDLSVFLEIGELLVLS